MGKINYRTDEINKKLKQIDELVDSNENLSNQINNFNSQLDTIETKLLNPEMFRFQDGIEVDDQTAINSALNVAYNTSNELHFYKDYSIDKLIINKNSICYFHDIKLTDKTKQNFFIKINN